MGIEFPRCESCEDEPMLDLPFELRRKSTAWAFWRFHAEAHELGREILRSCHRLLRWDRG